jgi:hypothetical protein
VEWELKVNEAEGGEMMVGLRGEATELTNIIKVELI